MTLSTMWMLLAAMSRDDGAYVAPPVLRHSPRPPEPEKTAADLERLEAARQKRLRRAVKRGGK